MFDATTSELAEGIGPYGYEKASERSIVSVCDNPYPCSFDRGIITTMARRFERGAAIVHDDSAPCRRRGLYDSIGRQSQSGAVTKCSGRWKCETLNC